MCAIALSSFNALSKVHKIIKTSNAFILTNLGLNPIAKVKTLIKTKGELVRGKEFLQIFVSGLLNKRKYENGKMANERRRKSTHCAVG